MKDCVEANEASWALYEMVEQRRLVSRLSSSSRAMGLQDIG